MDRLSRPAPGTNVIRGPAPRQADPISIPARSFLADKGPDPRPSRWFGLARIAVVWRDRGEPSPAVQPGRWTLNTARVPILVHLLLPATVGRTPTARPGTAKPYPVDEVMWGIAIRDGYDELDDPSYHRGLRGHAYREGDDRMALCGFRPPRRGLLTRRPAKLGIPTARLHPMCGTCARRVVAHRGRMPRPVLPRHAVIAVPVGPVPAGVARATSPVLEPAHKAATRVLTGPAPTRRDALEPPGGATARHQARDAGPLTLV